MLFKVQYKGKQKYIKLNGTSYPEFLNGGNVSASCKNMHYIFNVTHKFDFLKAFFPLVSW